MSNMHAELARTRGSRRPSNPLRGASPLTGRRLLVAIGGPVDVIGEHHRRYQSRSSDEALLRTSLGDLFEMCERNEMRMHVISTHPQAGVVHRGPYVLEHRAKSPARGRFGGHVADLAYGRHLVQRALELGADTAILESGVVDYFLMGMLKRAGIKVIPLLHHCLWPVGYPPRRAMQRVRHWLNGRFFRNEADAVICVSSASARQVRVEARSERLPILQMRLQLDPRAFEGIVPPPPHQARPFGVLYAGRIEHCKGVFDLLEMAERLQRRHPGGLRWYILGDGSAREDLAREVDARGLRDIVELPGSQSMTRMRWYYQNAHISVVPTRSTFVEGMAMTAIEAVVAGRPVVTSSVVPALEVVGPACLEARVDDVSSYVDAIERLMLDEPLYAAKRTACTGVAAEFFDRSLGMASVIERALG